MKKAVRMCRKCKKRPATGLCRWCDEEGQKELKYAQIGKRIRGGDSSRRYRGMKK